MIKGQLVVKDLLSALELLFLIVLLYDQALSLKDNFPQFFDNAIR